MSEQFDDTYLSGKPINQRVFLDDSPKVKWTLPNGDRILTTLLDYNSSFPIVFNNETNWRNALNERKRQRIGLSENG